MLIRYICASGCSWCGWSLKIIQNPPIFTENWRLPDTLFASLPLVSEKIWAACSDLCVIGIIHLRKNSMQVQWMPWKLLLVYQDLSQCKWRWTDLRLIQHDSSKSVATKTSTKVFNPQFKKHLAWVGVNVILQSLQRLASFLNEDGRMAWRFQVSPSFTYCHNFGIGPLQRKNMSRIVTL